MKVVSNGAEWLVFLTGWLTCTTGGWLTAGDKENFGFIQPWQKGLKMGLDFIRTKGERFVQRRDEARDEELHQEDLVTGTKGDVVIVVFRCQLEDRTVKVAVGQPLILRHIQGNDMHVISRNRKIGHVLPDEVQALLAAMRLNNHASEFLSVVVVDGPGLDETFTVKPKKPFKK